MAVIAGGNHTIVHWHGLNAVTERAMSRTEDRPGDRVTPAPIYSRKNAQCFPSARPEGPQSRRLPDFNLLSFLYFVLPAKENVLRSLPLENETERVRAVTITNAPCTQRVRALPALRGVTFCADRKSPKSCPGETLSVVLPHAKAALPWVPL